MDGLQRLSLDDLPGRGMFGNALRFWEQTRHADHVEPVAGALLSLCDQATNVYHTDRSGNAVAGYRLTMVNDAFDLFYQKSWALGDYPDRHYAESIILPSYALLDAEDRPLLHRVRARLQGHFAVYERLMLPYDGGGSGHRACLSVSRLRLLVENVGTAPVPLSAREQQCLRFLTDGRSAKWIAAELGLAQKTVENCVTRLKAKLDAENTAQAVAKGAFLLPPESKPAAADRLLSLSPRETQCLNLLVAGRSARQIAVSLGVSQKTVEKHIEAVKGKVAARNVAELAAKAIALAAPQDHG